jgi:hypothetical protein
LDIRVVVTRQNYNQEYDFLELDPLFVPSRVIELIPEPAPKHRLLRRGIQSGILVRLRRRAHHPPLKLPANVQSLENKVDELRARISFQRDIRDCNIAMFL